MYITIVYFYERKGKPDLDICKLAITNNWTNNTINQWICFSDTGQRIFDDLKEKLYLDLVKPTDFVDACIQTIGYIKTDNTHYEYKLTVKNDIIGKVYLERLENSCFNIKMLYRNAPHGQPTTFEIENLDNCKTKEEVLTQIRRSPINNAILNLHHLYNS